MKKGQKYTSKPSYIDFFLSMNRAHKRIKLAHKHAKSKRSSRNATSSSSTSTSSNSTKSNRHVARYTNPIQNTSQPNPNPKTILCHDKQGKPVAHRFRSITYKTETTTTDLVILFNKEVTIRSCTILHLNQFISRFNQFTNGLFQSFTTTDWQHMAVAGGSILQCLTPSGSIVQNDATSYNHSVNIYLYGLSDQKARQKINEVYQRFKRLFYTTYPSNDGITVIHADNQLRFVFPDDICYPSVNIVLRLYENRDTIVNSFDIDCCGVLYNGRALYTSPRAALAINTQCNVAVPERSNVNYATRLIKYVHRGYAVAVPSLNISLRRISTSMPFRNKDKKKNATWTTRVQTNFTMEGYLDSRHLRKVLIAGLQWEENRSPSMLECDAYIKSLEINYQNNSQKQSTTQGKILYNVDDIFEFFSANNIIVEFEKGALLTGKTCVGGAENLEAWEEGVFVGRDS